MKPAKRIALSLAIVFGMALTSGNALNAAVLTYAPPAIIGNTVSYVNVSESSSDPLPLYGTPGINGDTLIFRNMSFRAESNDAVPTLDVTDGQLNLVVEADEGRVIDFIDYSEWGDFSVIRESVSGLVRVTARVPGGIQISVLEVGGVPLGVPDGPFSAPVVFVPAGFTYTEALGSNETSGNWSGTAFIDIESLTGYENVTKLSVTLDNQLTARSQAEDYAAIAKKGVDFTVGSIEEPPIPEPATLALFAMGLPILLWRRVR